MEMQAVEAALAAVRRASASPPLADVPAAAAAVAAPEQVGMWGWGTSCMLLQLSWCKYRSAALAGVAVVVDAHA